MPGRGFEFAAAAATAALELRRRGGSVKLAGRNQISLGCGSLWNVQLSEKRDGDYGDVSDWYGDVGFREK
ncbi:unnamed protein product [Linum trigynum]|uniref:Uncharacterized protein n=1 Tax=Linum trigynum TaxID=586398 RepID=A0AAV2CB57_9ROSI